MNDEQLTERTVAIIEAGGRIVLKRNDCECDWYLHQHTSIASGPDEARFTSWRRKALSFFNLKWARRIAPLYNCKVVVVYPKKKIEASTVEDQSQLVGDSIQQAVDYLEGMSDEEFHQNLTKATARLKELQLKTRNNLEILLGSSEKY